MENVRFAGFWWRFLASAIDGFIVLVAYFVLAGLLWGFPAKPSVSNQLLPIVIGVAYYVWFLTSKWQATPGKRMLSLYVVSHKDGTRIAPGTALLRYAVLHAASLFFVAMMFFYAGSLTPSQGGSTADLQRMQEIVQKQIHQQYVTPEEQDFLFRTNRMSVATQAHLSPDDTQRFMDIGNKEMKKIPLTDDEKAFDTSVNAQVFKGILRVMLWLLPMMIYSLVIAFMVGLTNEKTGPHDLAAGTRVIHGRPAELVTSSSTRTLDRG